MSHKAAQQPGFNLINNKCVTIQWLTAQMVLIFEAITDKH